MPFTTRTEESPMSPVAIPENPPLSFVATLIEEGATVDQIAEVLDLIEDEGRTPTQLIMEPSGVMRVRLDETYVYFLEIAPDGGSRYVF